MTDELLTAIAHSPLDQYPDEGGVGSDEWWPEVLDDFRDIREGGRGVGKSLDTGATTLRLADMNSIDGSAKRLAKRFRLDLPYLAAELGSSPGGAQDEQNRTQPSRKQAGRKASAKIEKRNSRIRELKKEHGIANEYAKLAGIAKEDSVIKGFGLQPVTREIVRNVLAPRSTRYKLRKKIPRQ